MTDRPEMPLLDTVRTPAELRKLDKSQLGQLCDELRAETISAVSVTGGHLGAGLGVVELALTTGLTAAGGTRAPVVAAVLVYRALTYLLQILLGAAAYLVWRRTAPRSAPLPAAEAGSA